MFRRNLQWFSYQDFYLVIILTVSYPLSLEGKQIPSKCCSLHTFSAPTKDNMADSNKIELDLASYFLINFLGGLQTLLCHHVSWEVLVYVGPNLQRPTVVFVQSEYKLTVAYQQYLIDNVSHYNCKWTKWTFYSWLCESQVFVTYEINNDFYRDDIE